MAKIEIWTRDVSHTSMLGNKAPQHIFLIKTNDNGTREIIRGGPSQDNMITGDVKIINQDYNDIKQDDKITKTYDYLDPSKPNILNYQGSTIKIASQSQIDAIWKNGLNKAQNINLGKFDYEPLTQNSNTVIYKISLEMNLGNEVKNFLDQKEAWAPGYGNDFTQGLIDKGIGKGWDYLYEFPGDFKNDLTTIKNWIDDFKNTRQFENNEIKNSFNQKYSFEILQGDKSIQLANSNLIASDAIYVDENNNPVSLYDSLFVGKDSQMKSFTIIKNNIYTTLQDNSKATLNSILNTLDSSIEITANFLTFQAQKTAEIILTKIKSDKYLDSLIGSVLADIILGENDAKQISKNLAKGQLNSLVTSLLDENIRKILIDSGMTTTQINNLVGPKAVNYAVTYDNSGNKIITAYDANGNLIGPTLNGTIYTAILNFAISAADSSGWSSEEYGTASANQNLNYHPKLNFNNNQKPNKKLVANDNYENIFILSLIKNA